MLTGTPLGLPQNAGRAVPARGPRVRLSTAECIRPCRPGPAQYRAMPCLGRAKKTCFGLGHRAAYSSLGACGPGAEAGDHVVPCLADEGHAGAVVLARDAAEYGNHEVVGELVVRQKVRRRGRRLGCGHGGGGGRRDRRPERMSVERRRLARPARLLPGTGRMVEEEGVGGGAGSERAFYFGPEAGGGASCVGVDGRCCGVAGGRLNGLGGKEERKAWPTSFGSGCYVGRNWLGLRGWAELDCWNQLSWGKKSLI